MSPFELLEQARASTGEPMRIIAFVLNRPQLAFGFDQTPAPGDWPEMDQTAGQGADGWE